MNLGTTALPAVDTNSLQKLSELPTELALQRASHLLAHLVKDPAFLEAEIRPHLEEARSTEGDWYVAKRYEGEDHSYSLQIFVWPPSTETKIHDHSSWGFTAVPWGPYSRSATSDWMTAPGSIMLT
jgi:predicted metal-dependent enzyme (double-stranded beta helix superfamily)